MTTFTFPQYLLEFLSFSRSPAYSLLSNYWLFSSLLNQSQRHLFTQCKGWEPQPLPGEEPEPLSSSFSYSGLSYSQRQRNCDYCCGAGGCLKDPTPGKAQMLCPHKPHAPLVKGAEHSWNPQAHCLHVGRTAPGPICFTMVGAQGSWVSFSLVFGPLPTVPVFPPSPIVLQI